MDQDDSGEIDFKEFVHGMSQFSSHGDKETKLRFAFRIYDMDNDGFISNGELFQVNIFFSKCSGLNLSLLIGFEDDGGIQPQGHPAPASRGQDHEVYRRQSRWKN